MVAAGALCGDGAWIPARGGFLFPVKALSAVFRAKFLCALATALEAGRMALSGTTVALTQPRAQRAFFAQLRAKAWVVYAKRPFGGPEHVLEYLGRYTHRVAFSNERLVRLDANAVHFRYKDYAHGNRRRVLRLEPLEFLRRFALHVLPRGFNRIRHFGLIANRNKHDLLTLARAALDTPRCAPEPVAAEPVPAFWQRVIGIDIARCPHCNRGTSRVVAAIAPEPRPPP